MKMVCLFVSAMLPAVFLSAQSLVIRGRITDADTLMILFRSTNKCDTIFTVNGTFRYIKKLDQPELISLVVIRNNQSIAAIREGNEQKVRSQDDGVVREFFFEKGNISFTTSFSGIPTVALTGTSHEAQDIYNSFQQRFHPLVRVARTIIDSSWMPARTEPEKQLCTNFYKRVEEVENEVALQFVKENTSNAVGAYVLDQYCRIEDAQVLNSLCGLFSPSLQNTVYIKNSRDKVKALTALHIGKPVPPIISLTNKGKTMHLGDYKGKYVVLDFWGSWCGPCLAGIGRMKSYYSRYKNTLEIVGIACRDTEQNWKAAVDKYGLGWTNIMSKEPHGFESMYHIETFPTKMIIDKESNLIAVYKGENEAFYQALDSLLSK